MTISAKEISDSLAEFSISDQLLLSRDVMIGYPNMWVAAFRGEVVAAAHDLAAIRDQLTAKQVPLSRRLPFVSLQRTAVPAFLCIAFVDSQRERRYNRLILPTYLRHTNEAHRLHRLCR